MSQKLSDVSTELFLFDPKKQDFVQKMQEIEQFNFKVPKLDMKKVLTMIVLLYDIKSELVRIYNNYYHRKKEAALIAGWELKPDGRLPEMVEFLLLGKHSLFNKAVVHYCFMSKNPYFVRLATLEFNYSKIAAESYEKYDDKIHDLMKKMESDIIFLREKIFGGDEVEKMREALYGQLEEVKNMLTLEDRVDRIEAGTIEQSTEFNPYGTDYVVDRLKYEGDEIPTD